MFDLNLNADSIEASQMEKSATSNSSNNVYADNSSNTGGDDDSCSTRGIGDAFTFNFDILKEEGAKEEEFTNNKELFLFRETKELDNQSSSNVSSSRKSWMSLSFDHENSKGEMKMLQAQQQPQQQQKVKKSRRGPRSRSSQYRGVTFYRRTGRWESHIWYFIFI